MENLKLVRNDLLELHKVLMEKERINYEKQFGSVTNMQLLNLLFENENFKWLRDISSLVADIDELFASKDGVHLEKKSQLFDRSKNLFDESDHYADFKSQLKRNIENPKVEELVGKIKNHLENEKA